MAGFTRDLPIAYGQGVNGKMTDVGRRSASFLGPPGRKRADCWRAEGGYDPASSDFGCEASDPTSEVFIDRFTGSAIIQRQVPQT